jgi:hyperosmotically inducible periplasmic protein
MKTTRTLGIALVVAAVAGLAACNEVAPERTAGEKLDMAIDSTRHSVFDAGRKVEAQADNAVLTLKGTRDAVGAGAIAAVNVIDDAAIVTSINADFLKDGGLAVLKIDVDSREGVVSLNGLAGSEEARVRAGLLAAAVKGVHEVRNYLVVKRI